MLRILLSFSLALGALQPPLALAGDGKGMTLAEVTGAALRNPLAQAAYHESRAAKARHREMLGVRYPRIKLTSFVAPSPEVNCENVECTTTSPHDVPINVAGVFAGANLSVTQVLYTFGKGSAVSDATRSAADAATHKEDAVAGDLVYQAARAFYGLKLARELIWMLEGGKEEIDKGRGTLESKLAEGSSEVTIQDRMRLETLAAEVDARLAEAREAEAIALAGVRALVGDNTADIDDAPLTPAAFDLQAKAGDYVDRARTDLPALKAARAGTAALGALARYQRARYLPDLILIGGVNVARATAVDNPPSAFARDPFNTTGGQLAMVLRWKLDPVAQPARVDRAREQARRAAALLEAAGRAAEFEVRRAHARAKHTQDRLEAAKKGEKAARGWVASVVQADAVGTADAKDFADAYVAYFTLHGRVLQSAYDWNLAIVGLRRAVGEFTAERPRH